MPVTSLPWVHAPDLAAAYLRGVSEAGSLSMEARRLSQEQQRTEMEGQLRAQAVQRDAAQEQQRIEVAKARGQAETAFRQQQLQQAAQKMLDQAGFAKDMASGMSVEKALYRHPSLSTPNAVIAARKDSEDLGGQRLDLKRQQQEAADEFKRQQLDLARQRLTDAENKKPKVPNVSGAKINDEGVHFDAMPADSPLLNRLVTNSPVGLGTNWGKAMPAPAAETNAPAGPSLWERITGAFGGGNGTQGTNGTNNEVIRLTKDGQKAVFDGSSKKFLRWADASPQAVSESDATSD